MKLSQLSSGYDESAERIAARLDQLRLALRDAESAEEVFRLRRRIEDLRPLLTQCRKLSCLTARYYDPEFRRYDEYTL